MYEEKQPRLAKAEGISSQGDFEQRRSGWGKPENKATCYECGNTDHFKAQCPIWIAKNKNREGGKPTTNTKGGNEKARQEKVKEMRFSFLDWSREKWARNMKKFRRAN